MAQNVEVYQDIVVVQSSRDGNCFYSLGGDLVVRAQDYEEEVGRMILKGEIDLKAKALKDVPHDYRCESLLEVAEEDLLIVHCIEIFDTLLEYRPYNYERLRPFFIYLRITRR